LPVYRTILRGETGEEVNEMCCHSWCEHCCRGSYERRHRHEWHHGKPCAREHSGGHWSHEGHNDGCCHDHGHPHHRVAFGGETRSREDCSKEGELSFLRHQVKCLTMKVQSLEKRLETLSGKPEEADKDEPKPEPGEKGSCEREEKDTYHEGSR